MSGSTCGVNCTHGQPLISETSCEGLNKLLQPLDNFKASCLELPRLSSATSFHQFGRILGSHQPVASVQAPVRRSPAQHKVIRQCARGASAGQGAAAAASGAAEHVHVQQLTVPTAVTSAGCRVVAHLVAAASIPTVRRTRQVCLQSVHGQIKRFEYHAAKSSKQSQASKQGHADKRDKYLHCEVAHEVECGDGCVQRATQLQLAAPHSGDVEAAELHSHHTTLQGTMAGRGGKSKAGNCTACI